ncbi:MAG: hypothetical protein A2091_08765 [Desulfuromonadales bacterium GWD2_61_12]|nr:MAG: hypothetical protein A2005_00625 [Desulfuromonadales bacterium GWC2_61_20]OGR32778.1 MAG: hypothetical protein A2091_08765 [Desulfuromonadales bacterium GWD2_61_12]HAD04749.1 glycerophosphodiester phosphodiesterase [Desulfuromonas sp.]HBT82746.1 glycerophosphodiester phosphodiesterase [Desulfuromonas sp.]
MRCPEGSAAQAATLFLWAHRGASAVAPENTLAAFRAAEGAGAGGIELDVHLSRDGIPVVIHDETLERTSNGHGQVARWSAAELVLLDAGGWFAPAFSGERIPTLEQVLAWAGERLRVNIEIKTAAAGAAVLRLLRDFPRSRVLVSSFDHRLLTQLHQQDPELSLGFLGETRFWRRGVRRAVAAGAESYHPRADLVSRPLLRACRSAGLAVYPWTIDAAAEVDRFLLLGVSGLFVNDPQCVAKHLKSKQTTLKLQE